MKERKCFVSCCHRATVGKTTVEWKAHLCKKHLYSAQQSGFRPRLYGSKIELLPVTQKTPKEYQV